MSRQDSFYLLLLAVLCMVLFSGSLSGFWRADDPGLLFHTIKYNPLLDFVNPSVWHEVSESNLTPLLTLSLWLDRVVAGPVPAFFYLHQLLMVIVLSVLAYRWLKTITSPGLAFTGVVIFLAGIPVTYVANHLMTRHYLEGLVAATAVLFSLMKYQQSGKALWLAVMTLCFALAVTAKEIYVPLGLGLSLHYWWQYRSVQPRSEIVRVAAPLLLVTACYIVWRNMMLPDVVGGYVAPVSYVDPQFWLAVLTTYSNFFNLLFNELGWLMLSISILSVVVILIADRKNIVILGLWAGAILLPLVPLVSHPGIDSADRYLLLPWSGLCVLWVVAAHKGALLLAQYFPAQNYSKQLSSGYMLLCLSCTMLAAIPVLPVMHSNFAAGDVIMQFVNDKGDDYAFIPNAGLAKSFWTIRGMENIKKHRDPRASVPLMISDDMLLQPGLKLFEYSAACQCMEDISSTLAARVSAEQASRRSDAPLSLQVSNDKGLINWTFGPYQQGQYKVVSMEVGSHNFPRQQRNKRTGLDRHFTFYLKYTSPAGWTTTSPELALLPDGTPLIWSRE